MFELTQVLARAAGALGATYVGLVLWDEAAEEPHLALFSGEETSPQTRAPLARWSVASARPRALLTKQDAQEVRGGGLEGEVPLFCAPFPGSDQRPRGSLIARLPQVGDEKELGHGLEILGCLAEWTWALLENKALQEEIQRKEEQVQDLIRGTLDAQEAERGRIYLEVHDGVTQTLASAFQYLQTLEGAIGEGTPARNLVVRARDLVRRAIQESREVINSLQPAPLRDLGLVATLRQEVRELEAEQKWKVDFKAEVARLPQDMEVGLYRIVREAIANAKKHSGADSLRVQLVEAEGRLVLEVSDGGRGFDPKQWAAGSSGRGIGLLSMRRRAELLGGSFTLESSPGQGTKVRVELPLAGWRRF